MPTFDTPDAISVLVSLVVGETRVTAADAGTTDVQVRPSDPAADIDVRAAQATDVEYADGRLVVRAPRPRRLGLSGRAGSVDVTVTVPSGSRVEVNTAVGAIRCTGRLGDCRLRSSTGDVTVDRVDALDLRTSAGAVDVGHVAGDAEIHTGSGTVRLGSVDGAAVVKNSNGESRLGTVGGDLRVNNANGRIAVERAGAGLSAATANGDIRIGRVEAGTVSLKTAFGQVEVGIAAGTATFLDAYTHFGQVRSDLAAAEAPERPDRAVQVRARTSYGDILVHRA